MTAASFRSLRMTEGASGTEYVISTSAMPRPVTASFAYRRRRGSVGLSSATMQRIAESSRRTSTDAADHPSRPLEPC